MRMLLMQITIVLLGIGLIFTTLSIRNLNKAIRDQQKVIDVLMQAHVTPPSKLHAETGTLMPGQTATFTVPLPEATAWRPINTAPRDGTVIEIKNNYGLAPWYDLFRWERK